MRKQFWLILFTAALGMAFAGCGDRKKSDGDADMDDSETTGDVSGDTPGDTGDVPGDTPPGDTPDVPVDMGPDFVTAEFGLDSRPMNTTCVAPNRPPSAATVELERAFPNLSFSRPVYMRQAPTDSSKWYVVEKAGIVEVFDNSDMANTSAEFINITGRVDAGPNEAGLLGMAFHPDWPSTLEVFLSYNGNNGGQLTTRISRFTSADMGVTLDPASEEIVLELDQPYGNHNGGGIDFGPDGFLYIGLGDGGSGNDPLDSGQDTNTLLGAFLRIDVDGMAPYSIPADNPFADGMGGLPEIFAWGVRNPWRWSFDSETGDLWAGDVGQGTWEEIDIIELGGNYGWKVREGAHCRTGNDCEGPYVDPIVEHNQNDGESSITGGYVYRGTNLPGLWGTYIYGDFVSGRIFKVSYDAMSGDPYPELLLASSFNISAFGQGHDGEMYVLNYSTGQIHRFIPAGPPPVDNFPRLLSETGCVDANNPTLPSAAMIPFDVTAKLWSDGAQKYRYFAIPDGTTISVDADGDWDFPNGSVLMKSFAVDGDLLETRLLIRHDDGGWAGYTYEWNDAGTDADLLDGRKVKDLAGGGSWEFPSRSDCMRCHTVAANFALGPETSQLNAEFDYVSTQRRANQLATLDNIGMFDAPLGDPATLPALEDPLGAGPVADRARAYLHSNCSSCHQSGGPTNISMDLRATETFADTQTCDVAVTGPDLGIMNALRIAPGDASRSLIPARMRATDVHRMPALGTRIVDEAGTQVIEDWINGLQDCN